MSRRRASPSRSPCGARPGAACGRHASARCRERRRSGRRDSRGRRALGRRRRRRRRTARDRRGRRRAVPADRGGPCRTVADELRSAGGGRVGPASRRSRRGIRGSTGRPVSVVSADSTHAVAGLEALQLVGRNRNERRFAGGEDLAGRRVENLARRAHGSPVLLDDPALGADLAAGPDRAAEGHVQSGRHAPRPAADHGPGHHLVEDRADDAAVGDGLPALERRIQRELGPRPVGARVEVEVQAVLVQLPAGEAMMGLELERTERVAALRPGREDLRCQGFEPCAPRP